MVSEGQHIGYYRGKRVGNWVARFRVAGGEENYLKHTLGAADDSCEANGTTILNWKQALDAANKWFAQQVSGDAEVQSNGATKTVKSDLTVADVVSAFIAMRDARETAKVGRPARSTASLKLTPHVLADEICTVKLCDLTEADIRAWQRRLRPMAGSSKQRVLSELKAALNDAAIEYRQKVPRDLAVTIKFGCRPVFAEDSASEPVARDNQVLPDETIRTILSTLRLQDADGDNYVLALLLGATGARFSQIVRMRVRDVDLARTCVFVPPSRKGRGKKSGAPIRIQIGRDIIEALHPFVDGREPNAVLLERWHYRQIKATEWERVGRQPWKTPSEMARWWKKAVDAAGVPGVIPYALRHSSIVRAIRADIPIRLVAALHDTSVAMIEKHYARWITESLDDIAARAIVPLAEAA
ncbi:tyrosine-type recombinase/integrase [Sphingomonas sp. DT-204]|uniref:tyrosine-type recombinase/integrase n=1 Tax=Sphingomonas sp. DT-204 TaxID=3396166 RepID=UPI003F1CDBB5